MFAIKGAAYEEEIPEATIGSTPKSKFLFIDMMIKLTLLRESIRYVVVQE